MSVENVFITCFLNSGAAEGGGARGALVPNMSNVPGVFPPRGYICLPRVYSYSRSASLTSLLHLTMHASRLELGPNFQALILFLWSQADPSQSVKVKLFDRGTHS